jgi:hypothetical protein
LLGHNYCLFRFQRKQIVLPLNFSIYFLFLFFVCTFIIEDEYSNRKRHCCWPLAIFAV